MDQLVLVPNDFRDWVPKDHPAHFIDKVVDAFDLSRIRARCVNKPRGGRPRYCPVMMVKLVLYGYLRNIISSRKLEAATREDPAVRMLACDSRPDHTTLAEFRRQFLPELSKLSDQVFTMCEEAGIVDGETFALDGTKVLANASKHKAMSYDRMPKKQAALTGEIERLYDEADVVDPQQPAKYGDGKREAEIPKDIARRAKRWDRIEEGKRVLKERARERVQAASDAKRKAYDSRVALDKAAGRKPRGRKPKFPDPAQAEPEPKDQYNFTDPDSRIMLDGATKAYVQAYNAQIVVDRKAQVIVAAAVTQQANDTNQLIPMLRATKQRLGRIPQIGLADAGYFSEENVTSPELAEFDLYIPPGRTKPGAEHGDRPKRAPKSEEATQMREKLKEDTGRQRYAKRKAIVEPAIGQIKEQHGFRRFSLRGIDKVNAEWDIVTTAHNLWKLFRAPSRFSAAPPG